MADETMVERVARAIGAELVRQELAGECDLSPEESDALLARAAIEAMMEPTTAMVQTACPSHIPGEEMAAGRGQCVKHTNAAFRWRAMIQAALNPIGG